MQFFGQESVFSLREQFQAVLYGDNIMKPQGRPILLRRFTDQFCVCWNVNEGGSNNPQCKYCGGEGMMWRETWETMFLTPGVAPVYKPGFLATGDYPQSQYGYTDPSRATAFCEYTVYPNYERYTFQQEKGYDKLFEMKVGENGGLYTPPVRTVKWKILGVTPWHGDFGRVEFLELALEKENVG